MTKEQDKRKLNLRKKSLELDNLKTELELDLVNEKLNSFIEENKKYGWSTTKNNFERYYLRQLKSFMTATNLFTDIGHLTEESSIEEISKTFDELIDFLKVVNSNRSIRHQVIPKGLYSDSYKYQTAEEVEQNSNIR